MLQSILTDETHDLNRPAPARPSLSWTQDENDATHTCDGCGETRVGVDLWAEDEETGDELWFCLACGDW